MSKLQTLKKNLLTARKNRDSSLIPILTVLVSETQVRAKNDGNREATDEDLYAVAKSFVKKQTKLIKKIESNTGTESAIEAMKAEIEIVKAYKKDEDEQ